MRRPQGAERFPGITAEEVRRRYIYDPASGVVLTRVPFPNLAAGSRAGWEEVAGRRRIKIDGKCISCARLIWLYVYGSWPNGYVDHINGDPSDDRIDNLRDVDPATNSQNIKKARFTNALGILGVCFVNNRYLARIRVKGKLINIGKFDTAEQAHLAYLERKRLDHPGCTI